MTLRVYYDDIDGALHPQWMLVPCNTSEDFATYSLDAPFERFWPEDFHDSMSVVTVSQASLVRDPFRDKDFLINVVQTLEELKANGGNIEFFNESEYFLVRMDDLEEIMQMQIRQFYLL